MVLLFNVTDPSSLANWKTPPPERAALSMILLPLRTTTPSKRTKIPPPSPGNTVALFPLMALSFSVSVPASQIPAPFPARLLVTLLSFRVTSQPRHTETPPPSPSRPALPPEILSLLNTTVVISGKTPDRLTAMFEDGDVRATIAGSGEPAGRMPVRVRSLLISMLPSHLFRIKSVSPALAALTADDREV